jgi:hypothetical protein
MYASTTPISTLRACLAGLFIVGCSADTAVPALASVAGADSTLDATPPLGIAHSRDVLIAVYRDDPCPVVDGYVRMANVPVGRDTVGICARFSEPLWNEDEGPDGSEFLGAFPFRYGPDGEWQFEAAQGPSRMFTTVGKYKETVGQATWRHRLWFESPEGFHIFERCEGGRLCAPSTTRYILVANGALVVDEICSDGCAMDDLLFRFEAEGEVTYVISAQPMFFEARHLPAQVVKLIERVY